MKYRKHILFLLLILTIQQLVAQQYYSIKDGLSDNDVQCIFRDSYGFLWIGTNNGLSRFDGYDFVNYSQERGELPSLSDNVINDICEDDSRNLWIATLNGLDKFDRKCNRIKCYTRETLRGNGLSNYAVFDLQIRDHHLFMSTWDGVSVLDMQNDSITNFILNKKNNWSLAGHSLAVLGDHVYLGTNAQGLFHLNLSTGKFSRVRMNIPGVADTNIRINCLQPTANHSVLAGTSQYGLYLLDCRKNPLETSQIGTCRKLSTLNSIQIKDSTVYLTGINDVYKAILTSDNRVTIGAYPIQSFDESLISTCSFLSSDELIWIGFWDKGIASYPTNNSYVKRFDLRSELLQQRDIKNISEDNAGNLLLFSYKNQENRIYDFTSQKESVELNHNRINIKGLMPGNLIQTADNDLWIIRKNEVTCYHNDGKTERYILAAIHDADRSYFFEGKNHVLYLLTSKNIIQYDRTKNNFVITGDNDYPDIHFAMIYQEDTAGNKLWFKTYNDFGYFDFSSRKATVFRNNILEDIPPVRNINCFHLLSDNNVLVGFNRGLYTLTIDGPKTRVIRNTSFPLISVSGIVPDRNGNLWISSNNGLFVLDSNENARLTIYNHHGTGATIYNKNICLNLRNGQLLFGAESSFIVVDPEKFLSERKRTFAPLLFTGINVSGSDKTDTYPLPTQEYLVTDISVPNRHNSITLKFAALDYIQPDRIEYAYRFKGLDSNWNYLGNKRVVTFSYLTPGSYIFEVKASNSYKEWQTRTTSLNIEILPPWYKTIWFRIMLLIAALIVLYSVYLIRIRSIQSYNRHLENDIKIRTQEIESQKEELSEQAQTLREVNTLLNERKEELETATEIINKANGELTKLNATKDKFFSIIAHDLKNPFMGILNFTDILQDQYWTLDDHSKLEYIQYLKQSSQSAYSLLENLLHWSRSQTNLIDYNPELFNIRPVADEVFRLLYLNADKKKIKLSLSMHDPMIVFADKNMITTVIRNLVRNAIKFTPEGGMITVETDKTESCIVIRIKDNEIGMNAEQNNKLFRIGNHNITQGTSGETGTGLGLILCKEFIDKNKGTIDVESEYGKGSTFVISLPADHLAQVPEIVSATIAEAPVILDPDNIPSDKIDEAQFKDNFILIVEDTPEIRDSLVDSLKRNYKILIAENGKKGLETALSEIPDFIISDVMMPEMDGFELTRMLKTDQRTSHIPLILLTARDSDASQIKGLETGADDYLIKPFKAEVLRTRIKNILQTRKKLREKFLLDALAEPRDLTTTNTDELFLLKAIRIVEDNISNPEFSVDLFVTEMGMSRTQLYRKMNQIVGQPINEFFRITRLKQSARLLLNTNLNISDVAYKVGFNDLQSFTRSFKKQFGMPPREWIILQNKNPQK